jgi:hypothetical protein
MRRWRENIEIVLLIRCCGRRGWQGFDCLHPCKAALGRLIAWVECKDLLQRVPLFRARFGHSGQHQPNLRKIGLLCGEGTQQRA